MGQNFGPADSRLLLLRGDGSAGQILHYTACVWPLICWANITTTPPEDSCQLLHAYDDESTGQTLLHYIDKQDTEQSRNQTNKKGTMINKKIQSKTFVNARTNTYFNLVVN